MASHSNGHNSKSAPYQFAHDGQPRTVGHPVTPAALAGPPTGWHSGRRLVLLGGAGILVLWGSLYLAFRDWRERYRARARFGVSQVAPAIDALADIVPDGVDQAAWREAVQETHEMLAAVLSANLLDVRQMELLCEELRQTVERSRLHPETARTELAGIWNDMADRADFVLQEGISGRRKGHPRPAILPPRPVREAPVRNRDAP